MRAGLLCCDYWSSIFAIAKFDSSFTSLSLTQSHPKLAMELKTCPFNARHLVPKNKLTHHTETCEDRRNLDSENGKIITWFFCLTKFLSVSMLKFGLITGEHEIGSAKWQVPISTWVNTNMTEDWDEGIINNSQLVQHCCVWVCLNMFVCHVFYCRGGWDCSSIRVGCEWQVSCLLQQCAATPAACLSTFCLFFNCCVFIVLLFVFLQVRNKAHQQSWFDFQTTKLPPMVRVLTDFVFILSKVIVCVYTYMYICTHARTHGSFVLKFLICTEELILVGWFLFFLC